MPDYPHRKIWPHPGKTSRAERNESNTHLPFIELQTASNFSFLRSASHPEEMIEQAALLGYPALGFADLNTLAGAVRAHIAAKELKLKLILGAEVSLFKELPEQISAPLSLPEEYLYFEEDFKFLPFTLTLYPINRNGYANLTTLLTKGKLRAPKGHCALTLEDLTNSNNLLAIINIFRPYDPTLPELLTQCADIFDEDRLSISIWNTYQPGQKLFEKCLLELSNRSAIPLVATNRCLYHIPARRELHDVLTCIRIKTTIEEAGYHLAANSERHIKPAAEMCRLFRKHQPAVLRTKEIADRISFSLDQLKYEYPREICPEGKSPLDHLRELTWQGLKQRYPNGVPRPVIEQIRHELSLIAELNYEKYFLTVYDIIQFAQSQKILCQGRGAAANSAVCYSLGITAVDPSKIRLLFERFISKERNEPPDIDIDFEHERREEVIQYIYKKFGRNRAALVSEVVTYRTRSSLRDVGKVFGLSVDTVEGLIKIVTRNDEITPELLEQNGLSALDRKLYLTIELANELKGFPRHLSQHVGGFVISETPLSEFVPIEQAAMEERTVIEWDKDDIENMGMLKIDILALGMLTCIRKSLELINCQSENQLHLYTIPAEDPAVYQMISQADTIGVFQIESRAQMSMLPRLKPRCFYDLVIEVAIVRPGPIQGGMVHPYLRRRMGLEKVTFPDQRIRNVLISTLGVPIFQEQVMELCIVAAGFTPGEADSLRRAMASWKRNKNLLKNFQLRIIEGMIGNGYSRSYAELCFKQIQGFGEYGFPQSHAASFALLVYVSAWLKKHYPAVFAASLINSQPMGFYQPAQLIEDAKRHGVTIRPIDVNFSFWDCSLEHDSGRPALRLGFRLVRGLQLSEAEKIIRHRKEGYTSLQDLWRQTGVRINTLKTLASADALQSLKIERQRAMWEIKRLRETPLPLFESTSRTEEEAILPQFSASSEVINDYDSTGLSLRAHPLSLIRNDLEEDGAITAITLKSSPLHNRCVKFAGLVLVRQRPGSAAGVTFLTLEDETGMANLIVKPEVFKSYRSALCDFPMIYVLGKVQQRDGITHIMVDKAKPLFFSDNGMPSLSRDFH